MHWLINPPQAFKPNWPRHGVFGEKFCFLGLCKWQPLYQPSPRWYISNIGWLWGRPSPCWGKFTQPLSLLTDPWKASLAFPISGRERNPHLGTSSCELRSHFSIKCDINVPQTLMTVITQQILSAYYVPGTKMTIHLQKKNSKILLKLFTSQSCSLVELFKLL